MTQFYPMIVFSRVCKYFTKKQLGIYIDKTFLLFFLIQSDFDSNQQTKCKRKMMVKKKTNVRWK